MAKAQKAQRSRSSEKLHTISLKLMGHSTWILVAVVILCLAIFGARYAYNLGYEIYDRRPRNVEEKTISLTITQDNIGDVAKALEKAGVIDSAFVFRLQAWLFKQTVQPGTYVVNTTTPSRTLLEQLNEGPVS